MKVSVIVPVYNAEKYLVECLESLVHQTLSEEDIEILTVDDCSTDASGNILETYARQYPQIRMLKTDKNSGPGGARNAGLDVAKGDYIGFVDSDDAVVSTMFEHLYQTAVAGDYDIVDSGIYYQDKNLAMVHTADEDTGEQTDEKRSHNIVSGGYLMTRLFRSTFWKESGVRFREHVTLEDMESLMYLTATAARIGNLKEICYIYRDTSGSASKEIEYEKYQKNAMEAMRATFEQMRGLPGYFGIRDAVEYTIIQLYSYALTNCLMQKGQIPDDEILQRQQSLCKQKQRFTTGGYDNPYVKNKVSVSDIYIMKMNDNSPERLFELVNI